MCLAEWKRGDGAYDQAGALSPGHYVQGTAARLRAQQHTLHQHEMISATSSPTLRDVVSAVSGANQKAQLVCRCFGSLI